MTTPTPEERERALKTASLLYPGLADPLAIGAMARVLLALAAENATLRERVGILRQAIYDVDAELSPVTPVLLNALMASDALAQQPKETIVEPKDGECVHVEHPANALAREALEREGYHVRQGRKAEPYRPKVGERARLESSPDVADRPFIGRVLLITEVRPLESAFHWFFEAPPDTLMPAIHRDATWSPVASDPVAAKKKKCTLCDGQGTDGFGRRCLRCRGEGYFTEPEDLSDYESKPLLGITSSDPVAAETREERLRRLGYEDTRPEGGCADALGLKRPEEMVDPVAAEKPTGGPSDDTLERIENLACTDYSEGANRRRARRAIYDAGRASEAASHAETKRVLRATSELAGAREKQRDEAEAELERVRGELVTAQQRAETWRETALTLEKQRGRDCAERDQLLTELAALREGRPEPTDEELAGSLQVAGLKVSALIGDETAFALARAAKALLLGVRPRGVVDREALAKVLQDAQGAWIGNIRERACYQAQADAVISALGARVVPTRPLDPPTGEALAALQRLLDSFYEELCDEQDGTNIVTWGFAATALDAIQARLGFAAAPDVGEKDSRSIAAVPASFRGSEEDLANAVAPGVEKTGHLQPNEPPDPLPEVLPVGTRSKYGSVSDGEVALRGDAYWGWWNGDKDRPRQVPSSNIDRAHYRAKQAKPDPEACARCGGTGVIRPGADAEPACDTCVYYSAKQAKPDPEDADTCDAVTPALGSPCRLAAGHKGLHLTHAGNLFADVARLELPGGDGPTKPLEERIARLESKVAELAEDVELLK